ncbi:Protein KVS-3 [Aphelenchoides avenae]|nr:Protein KVS-3 [Aphelenchus avenae]
MIPRVRSHSRKRQRLDIDYIMAKMSPTDEPIVKFANGSMNSIQKSGVQVSEMLYVNVGGRSAQLAMETIRLRLDESRLAIFCDKTHIERLTECDGFFEQTGEYYFEKSPAIFEYVIDYYVTGKLHRPMDVCPIRLRDELDFWRIPISLIAPCCRFPETKKHGLAALGDQGNDPGCSPVLFEKVWMGKARFKAWSFLENPSSGFGAKVWSIISALFVLLSLTGLILSSIPEFLDENFTPHWTIHLLEVVCMAFFTIEYLVRILVSPQKKVFVKEPLNVIDLFTIVPFYAEECLPFFGFEDVEFRDFRGAMVVIRVMRLARVARIFKLARYSQGLRAFGETMKKSAAELSMLGMFLLTGIMLFSTAIYFFERDEPNSKFYSIPASWWWCVATMTTVGYGDLVPATTGGKVVAAMASVCGIIVLAFPISMIIDKFAESTGDLLGEDPMLVAARRGFTNNAPGNPNFRSVRYKSKRHLF